MNLSKAFDTINHGLLSAEVKVYGFLKKALSLTLKIKSLNNKFSSLKEVIAGVPQGSIDGLLFFNLFINEPFLNLCFSTLSNYAYDNNLFTTGIDIQLINQMLLSDFRTVNNWSYENFTILNPRKFHFISVGEDTHDQDVFHHDKFTLKNSNEEEVSGVIIERKLTFHQHVKKVSRKAGQKLSALLRLSPYLDTNKRETIYSSMV